MLLKCWLQYFDLLTYAAGILDLLVIKYTSLLFYIFYTARSELWKSYNGGRLSDGREKKYFVCRRATNNTAIVYCTP